jgi:hypothetical protein
VARVAVDAVASRPGWQRPIDDLQSAEFDLGDVLAVLGVEMRRRVIGSIHPDDDPVERREARHPAIVGHGPASQERSARPLRTAHACDKRMASEPHGSIYEPSASLSLRELPRRPKSKTETVTQR